MLEYSAIEQFKGGRRGGRRGGSMRGKIKSRGTRRARLARWKGKGKYRPRRVYSKYYIRNFDDYQYPYFFGSYPYYSGYPYPYPYPYSDYLYSDGYLPYAYDTWPYGYNDPNLYTEGVNGAPDSPKNSLPVDAEPRKLSAKQVLNGLALITLLIVLVYLLK